MGILWAHMGAIGCVVLKQPKQPPAYTDQKMLASIA